MGELLMGARSAGALWARVGASLGMGSLGSGGSGASSSRWRAWATLAIPTSEEVMILKMASRMVRLLLPWIFWLSEIDRTRTDDARYRPHARYHRSTRYAPGNR
jgi:hypothetical protein